MDDLMARSAITAILISGCLAVPAVAQDPHPIDFDAVEWQTASVEDMTFLDAYIGDFRSETFSTGDSGKAYFFTIRYAWYNAAKTVIKWTIDTHIPADDLVRRNGEGFYAFDPFENRIMVTGFFPGRPVTSKGWMSEFDPETGERVVRIMAMSPDGQVTQVRDTFWIIDENTWGNATYVSVDGGEWQALPQAVYTRIEAE
jgi:hypothetical protein